MTPRVVYDTMIFLQWFGLPDDRQHGSLNAVLNNQVTLLLSSELVIEIRGVLSRANIRARLTSLTDARLNTVLNSVLVKSEFFPNPAPVFTLPEHPDDDHIFNLAIAGRADFLVTWENRILKLANVDSVAARELRSLAPRLAIVNPVDFMSALKHRAES